MRIHILLADDFFIDARNLEHDFFRKIRFIEQSAFRFCRQANLANDYMQLSPYDLSCRVREYLSPRRCR